MPSKPAMLIVDDESNVARTLKMVFEREGFEVETAFSCADALKLLDKKPPLDVLITDLNMEREDIGLEVARAAQQLKKRPVIVICTGYANPNNAQEALDLRVDYLATKPADLNELLAALRRLLALRAAQRGAAQ
ncbi:MAG TPA: response regulator [Terriglobales bacterium]|nr:response regulator [Terriglobales bacterium]